MFIVAWRLDQSVTSVSGSYKIIWSLCFLWEAGDCKPVILAPELNKHKPDPLEDSVSGAKIMSADTPSTVCCLFLEAPKTSRWLFFP